MCEKLKIVLFDTKVAFENLLPLSYTRPIGKFRIGILTISEKWERLMGAEVSFLPVEYLRNKYPAAVSDDEDVLFVSGNVLPDSKFIATLGNLNYGEGLVVEDGECIALRGTLGMISSGDYYKKTYDAELVRLQYVYDIFINNGEEIRKDYALITQGRESKPISSSNIVIGDCFDSNGAPMIFVEEGAKVEGVILNVANGPIYIGKDAEIMEGSCVRGPFALCEHSVVKMGAKVYEETTFGPYCKVGGEVSNAVFFGYSNKAHDGYLGNAVIGEWCNLGAGATASNLKNDYAKIRIWNYALQGFMRTDLQFCGLIMGDHSKAGINTMFNTATVVGVGVNFHGSGFPRTFIPSFQTGGPEGGFTDVRIDDFMEVARKVMARRGLTLNDADRKILDYIYNSASRFK